MTDNDENTPETHVTDEELAALRQEREVFTDESLEAQSRRLLRESAPLAVTTVVNIARSGGSDRVRLDASKYLLDRVLGKVGDDAFGDELDPLTAFVKGVEAHANAGSSEKEN
jgi:hypothetical protein